MVMRVRIAILLSSKAAGHDRSNLLDTVELEVKGSDLHEAMPGLKDELRRYCAGAGLKLRSASPVRDRSFDVAAYVYDRTGVSPRVRGKPVRRGGPQGGRLGKKLK